MKRRPFRGAYRVLRKLCRKASFRGPFGRAEVKRVHRAIMKLHRQGAKVTLGIVQRKFKLDCSLATVSKVIFKPMGMKYTTRPRKPAVPSRGARREASV